jgi:hypothetical protein
VSPCNTVSDIKQLKNHHVILIVMIKYKKYQLIQIYYFFIINHINILLLRQKIKKYINMIDNKKIIDYNKSVNEFKNNTFLSINKLLLISENYEKKILNNL